MTTSQLRREIDCLRSEIAAGKAGRTIVTRDWLRWARNELRTMIRKWRTMRRNDHLANNGYQILHRLASDQPSTVAHFGLLELAQATADEMAARISGDGETLSSLLASGLLSELSYMSADQQAECLERAAFLSTCEPDEIADAADFLALVITASR